MSFNVDGLNHCGYAHSVVRETACPSCGSPRFARCIAKGRRGFDVVLAPSRSHRPRLEAHARKKAA